MSQSISLINLHLINKHASLLILVNGLRNSLQPQDYLDAQQ